MGYIYKITNTINNKIYIGQTIKTIEKRFQQHKNNSNKEYFSQIVLYKAFRKYGIENFKCELVEEVDNKFLDEREKYWINYYDSYLNGYNSTLGGRIVQLYNWDVDEIIDLYHQLKSARKVAKKLGCDHNTIDNLLNANNVRRYTLAEQLGRPICLKSEKEELHFQNPKEAAIWLIENNRVKSKNIRCVRQYLTNNYIKNKPYYGYQITYEE